MQYMTYMMQCQGRVNNTALERYLLDINLRV